MAEGPGTVRIAALGDLHVEETSHHPYREMFVEISKRADVLALAGDLTNLGRAEEARILADELQYCTIPVVGVLGNHDFECGQALEVAHILRQGGMCMLETQVHEFAGVGFAGVKGFAGGFGARMLSAFGEEAIKHFVDEAVHEAMRLENALHVLRTDKKVVVLHYAPIIDTVIGEPPEIFPFLGSSRLAETIDRFDISAVVHGHAHRGTYTGKTMRGVPVYNCAQHVEKPSGRPYALFEV